MTDKNFPNNLNGLYKKELHLRDGATQIILDNPKLSLHFQAIERAMTIAKLIVEFPTADEDFKVIKMLSIRIFNAFGASQSLMFSGYHQNSGMILRDILETLFLMDLFKTDRPAIERWRLADYKARKKEFSAKAVREFLNKRDGAGENKRAEIYKMFSDLSVHPNMHSQHMLRPEKGADIVVGPFMESTTLQAGLSELGRLAIQAGDVMNAFSPAEWDVSLVRASYSETRKKWADLFGKQLY